MGVVLDLCMKHGLADRLVSLLRNTRDMVDSLDQIDFSYTADPTGLPYLKQGSDLRLNESKTAATNSCLKRVGVFLASCGKMEEVRLLLEACRRRHRFSDAIFLVHLFKDPQVPFLSLHHHFSSS